MPEKKLHPSPNGDASLFGNELIAHIRKNGPMTVAQFMEKAVSYYYASKDPFGTDGDFTTAPEISQMFGEMIGAWFVDVWLQMGQPQDVQLIELGPGRGTLMADIMRTMSAWPDLKQAVTIHMVEQSPNLRQAQADALKAFKPTWYDHFEEIPAGISFVVTNEFFDALPIHQFKKVKGEWKERCVGYNDVDTNFHFTFTEPSIDIPSIMPADFLNAVDGSIFEISPASLSVFEQICKRIADHGGAGLVIDYGHSAPGLGDTLQSVFKHKYSDVLDAPGTKDITAHVDFSLLKTVGDSIVDVHGPVTQGEFLSTLGITARAQALSEQARPDQKKDIMTALHRLTSVKEMGLLFKVIGLVSKDIDITPAGFTDEQPEEQD